MTEPIRFITPEVSPFAVSIGSVNAGDVAEVTNSGIGNNVVLNFTLPKGDTGANGVCNIVTLTADDYAALSDAEKTNGTWYVIPVTP